MTKEYFFAVNVSVNAENAEQAEDLIYEAKLPKGVSIDDINEVLEEDD